MDIKDCVTFATEHPVCFLATNEGDQPRVRAVLLFFADEEGFYFVFLSPKDMVKQLKKNPKVEICFYNNAPDLSAAREMRITGRMELVHDSELTKRALKERGFIEGIIGRPLEPLLEIYRLHTGEGFFWTMNDILKEHELERIGF